MRSCRHCGCTESRACVTRDGLCHWVSPSQLVGAASVCSAPACQVAEYRREFDQLKSTGRLDIGTVVELEHLVREVEQELLT